MRTALFFCLFFITLRGETQLRLSSAGAMAALNGNVVATAPSSAPLNYLSATPVSGVAGITTPLTPLQEAINYSPSTLNIKFLTFAYQSALAWWVGYFNYKQAAEGLDFSGGGTAMSKGMAIGASNYILWDGAFTQYQNYSTRQATMIIRANVQSPVQFPMMHLINNASVDINTYTPAVSSYSAEVPLRF